MLFWQLVLGDMVKHDFLELWEHGLELFERGLLSHVGIAMTNEDTTAV